jgi:phytoene dehydrogenase-like protein
MSPKASKKQILLDFFQARDRQPIEVGDLHAARDELRRHLGPDNRTSLGYIAAVLREAGYEVRYEDRYSDPIMPEPYASRLRGVLEFHDLASAERSLLRLDVIFREYQSAADQAGMKWVRALVKKGKLRARSLAANPRVQTPKRQEKQEIVRWFQVWLETPDLLADWLALRKSSEEFRRLFGGEDAPS